MDNTKYLNLFRAFEEAPMEDFLKVVFKGITAEERKAIVLEDVSYHRLSADIVTLETFMCLAPAEKNRWIWARVEMDASTRIVREYFFTRDSYRKQSLESLRECLDLYLHGDEKIGSSE